MATFDVMELACNILATYGTEAALSGNAGLSRRKWQQMIRAGVANGLYQSGFLLPEVAKFLSGLGVKEVVAVQAGFQAGVFAAADQMMSGDRVGLGVSIIEGITSAYVGDALATQKKSLM